MLIQGRLINTFSIKYQVKNHEVIITLRNISRLPYIYIERVSENRAYITLIKHTIMYLCG